MTAASDRERARSGTAIRKIAVLAAFACAFLAVGWSAYWYIAQNMAMRELHLQLDREARRGRIWSCESMEAGGYPLAVSIDCRMPRLRIDDSGVKIVSAKRAIIRAQLYAPTLVEIDLAGPATILVDESASTLDWSSLRFDLRGLPVRLDRLSIVGGHMLARIGGLPPTSVETLHLHLKRATPAAMAPFALTVGLAGLDSPVLAQLGGGSQPALLTLLGAVTQLDSAGAGHWSERLDAWRAAGGRLAISAFSLTRGDLALQGDGMIGLDSQRRLEGRIGLRLRNGGPALVALAEASGKLQRNTLAGQMAVGVLGRPGEMKLDVTAENGALSIGPLHRIYPLQPLY